MTLTVVVGNPRQRSRTWQAAHRVADQLCGRAPDVSIDLVDLGGQLLNGGPALDEALAAVRDTRLLVVASPTYKGSYTGLLKLFLDRIGGGALAGVTAIPVMLTGDGRHALAGEVFLKPVLVELGASCPTRAVSLIDARWDEPGVLDDWLVTARAQLAPTLGALA